jgi:hypothetical protein
MKSTCNIKIQLSIMSIALLAIPQICLADGGAPVRATYSVPAPAELAAISFFPVEGHPALDRSADAVTLKYILPADLSAGRRIVVEMTGSLEPDPTTHFYNLKSAQGAATCSVTTKVTCLISYHPAELFGSCSQAIAEQLKNYLSAKYADDSALPKRIELIQSFIVDPGGVLTILMP